MQDIHLSAWAIWSCCSHVLQKEHRVNNLASLLLCSLRSLTPRSPSSQSSYAELNFECSVAASLHNCRSRNSAWTRTNFNTINVCDNRNETYLHTKVDVTWDAPPLLLPSDVHQHRWCVSSNIHLNVGTRGFPAEHSIVERWSRLFTSPLCFLMTAAFAAGHCTTTPQRNAQEFLSAILEQWYWCGRTLAEQTVFLVCGVCQGCIHMNGTQPKVCQQ